MQNKRLYMLETRIKNLENLVKESYEDFDQEAAVVSFTAAAKSLGLKIISVTHGVGEATGAEGELNEFISGVKNYPFVLIHTGLKLLIKIDVSSEFNAPKWKYNCQVTLDFMNTTQYTARTLVNMLNNATAEILSEISSRIQQIDKELNGPKDTKTLIKLIGYAICELVDDIADEQYDSQAWYVIKRYKLTALKACAKYHLLPELAKDSDINMSENELKSFISEHSREIDKAFKSEAEANYEVID